MLERVARIDALGDIGLCQVHNVSDTGMMIETSIDLSPGDPVRISFDCTHRVQGRVAWQLGSRAGIRFLRPIESSALVRNIVQGCSAGSTRAPRIPVKHSARVTSASASFPTIVGNISQGGMNICHGGHLQVGTAVEVSLKTGVTVRGTVRWSAGYFAGIELTTQFPLSHLAKTRKPLVTDPD